MMFIKGFQACFGHIFMKLPVFLSIFVCVVFFLRKYYRNKRNKYGVEQKIVVFVLGDIGRSPRMQNHASCLSKTLCSKRTGGQHKTIYNNEVNDYKIVLVGYNETKCSNIIVNDSNIHITGLSVNFVDSYRSSLPLSIYWVLKLIEQSVTIIITLMKINNLVSIITQVPPSLPTLPLLWFVCLIHDISLIIDWHNYGYTLLGRNKNADEFNDRRFFISRVINFIMAEIYKIVEFSFGKLSNSCFCVSNAMKNDLKSCGINATVLYDKPNESFIPIESYHKRHEMLYKYFGIKGENCILDLGFYNGIVHNIEGERYNPSFVKSIDFKKSKIHNEGNIEKIFISQKDKQDKINNIIETTPVTKLSYNSNDDVIVIENLSNKPVILTTATSWTPDENLDLLLESLLMYNDAVKKQRMRLDSKSINNNKTNILPNLFIIITGKGPLKDKWINKAKETNMKYVQICTMFLPSNDYPVLLGCADLGISLHYSSSNMDLPMKVVDMLGVGLPVISHYYYAINELINEPLFDMFFDSSESLFIKLSTLLGDYYNDEMSLLSKLRNKSIANRPTPFIVEWKKKALPIIKRNIK